jgi:ABC-2 type transport system ATP-binding protein
MRLLVGLITADAGEIELLGRRYSWRDRQRLHDVGALVESPTFYEYLSGRDNLRVLAASGASAPDRRVDEVLALMGLSERGRDKAGRYSLGMKQRLGIAAALLSDPRLLLLDEPANGLDPAGIVGMRDTLRGLAAAGKTVLVSSHILGEIQQLADMVGIIAHGKLVTEGPVNTLLASSGGVRLRVEPADVTRAVELLDATGGTGAAVALDNAEGGWIRVRFDPMRAAELNRSLAQAGIFASRVEVGTDLESLFLELTSGGTADDATRRAGQPGARW